MIAVERTLRAIAVNNGKRSKLYIIIISAYRHLLCNIHTSYNCYKYNAHYINTPHECTTHVTSDDGARRHDVYIILHLHRGTLVIGSNEHGNIH